MQQYETNIQYRVKDIMRPLRNKCILFVTNLSSLEILAKTSRNLKEQLFVGAHLRIRVWLQMQETKEAAFEKHDVFRSGGGFEIDYIILFNMQNTNRSAACSL